MSDACRSFGISRKTCDTSLGRYGTAPSHPLTDHSRRPLSSPNRTVADIETAVLKVRDEFGWGPRKIHAFLLAHGLSLPSVRTMAAILKRHGRIDLAAEPPPPLQRFERARPNELWQCDFKGYLE